jgi:hypothetical protein
MKYLIYLQGGRQLLMITNDYRAACRHARAGKVVKAEVICW